MRSDRYYVCLCAAARTELRMILFTKGQVPSWFHFGGDLD